MAKRALGKGISAILEGEIAKVNRVTDAGAEQLGGQVAMISLDAITTNPFQPRSNFDNDALVELAQSISELGIIQPITVRKNGMKFELISGERRFRASQIAGLEEIPAYVRLADDRNMLELAIVENLQKEFTGRLFLEVRKNKSGLGTAYIHGFKWALERGYSYILEMDADFSHHPKELSPMLAYLKSDYDMVIGSRYIKGINVVNWPLSRILLSYLASLYVR